MPRDESTTTNEETVGAPFPGDLLDWFAGQALSNPKIVDYSMPPEAVKNICFAHAEAMIAEKRRREQSNG